MRRSGGGGQDFADLVEVGRPEHTRGCDREELRVRASAIVKAVNLATPDADRRAGPDRVVMSVDRERQLAREPVYRLLEGVVAVRRRNLCAGRNAALEHRHAAT